MRSRKRRFYRKRLSCRRGLVKLDQWWHDKPQTEKDAVNAWMTAIYEADQAEVDTGDEDY